MYGIKFFMQRIGFHSLYTYMDGPMNRPGSVKRSSVMAMFEFENNISSLFPYINAVADKAELHKNPDLVRFVFNDIYCVVYSKRCIATPFEDRESAKKFRELLVEFLNDILEKKDQIVPKLKVFKKIAVPDVLKLLPKTNCAKCGFPSCMTFAAMLSKQRVNPSACPYIGRPLNEQVTYPVFDANGIRVSSVTLDVDTSQDFEKKLPEHSTPVVNDDVINAANNDLPEALTRREVQVLSMMAQGLTNREISNILNISPHTVKSHVVHIFNKLGVNQRTQAVVWAARHELI